MQVLIVCGKNVRARIIGQCGNLHQPPNLCWPENIYGAVAAVVKSERREIPVTVCVQVDALNRLELQVFSTLAVIETASVIAFSAFRSGQDEKLDFAQREGAEIIDDLAGLCDWLQRQNQGNISGADAILEEILGDKVENEVTADPEPPENEPDSGPPIKEKVSADQGEPLISDDELNALLGQEE
jgi:hypothetical protein